jgi:hypothetical protein
MTDTQREFSMLDAPCHYGAEQASAWASGAEHGYQAALAQSWQWISVKDRLPINDYEVVFVLLSDLSCGVTFSREGAKSWLDDETVDICIFRIGEKWHCAQGDYCVEKIKFWMPIPQPPITNRKDE